MARPSIDWLITDTHFYHDHMIEACGRPADFTELLMRNLRYLIADQDRLFHLGDVVIYKYDHLKDILDSIKGTKVLVKGNHDSKSDHWYSRHGFSFVADAIMLGDIYLTHKPVKTLPEGARLNVHGHWHNMMEDGKPIPAWWSTKTHRLLSVEYTKYMPVKLQSFIALGDKHEAEQSQSGRQVDATDRAGCDWDHRPVLDIADLGRDYCI